jgi:arylsulfatase A-like enzyme
MGKKLNLIMITIDGARVDRIMQFKSFQQLKSLGSFFSQVITYAPYTIGSMHAIFTGTYGPKTGVNNYYGSRSFKKDRYLTLPGILQKEGYVTIGDIINDLIVPKEGFDDLKVHDELKDDLTLRHCDLLERVKKLNDNDHNYFLYLHYSNIHTEIMKNVLKKYTNFSKEYFVKRIENLAAYDRYIAKADDYLTAV